MEATLCFRKQLILENSLLILENLSSPLSIRRTFTQPGFFSLILFPHRKATSFFVLLICFNQIAQWYKTQNKGRWVLLVYSGCVLEQFGFLPPSSPVGFPGATSIVVGSPVPSLDHPTQANNPSWACPSGPASEALQGMRWCLRQTDSEQNSFLRSKWKSMLLP